MTATEPVTLTAVELAARLMSVAERVDAAEIVPLALEVTRWNVVVQVGTEAAVDRVVELFDDAESADPDATNYTRVAFFDDVVTVNVFSGRTLARCRCGAVCEHRAVSA